MAHQTSYGEASSHRSSASSCSTCASPPSPSSGSHTRTVLTLGRLARSFFASLHPWIMMLSLDDDRDAMAVRDKSPLLFHTILLLSTAYSTPFPSQLHLTLVTFLNNILAPQLLNPQPHELTTDFLRALDLLNIYKPVQFGARRAEGHDDTEAMRVSKVNGLASWMLQGILARTAERLELKETVSKFARAYSASASGAPVPKELLRDLRCAFSRLAPRLPRSTSRPDSTLARSSPPSRH